MNIYMSLKYEHDLVKPFNLNNDIQVLWYNLKQTSMILN